MKFVKIEALGIDSIFMFGVLDRIRNYHAFSERMCDRHYGIGGEFLVIIDKASSSDFVMRAFDRTGKEYASCSEFFSGAGTFLYNNGLSDTSRFSVGTGAGVRTLELSVNNGLLEKVIADLGVPVLNTKEIPVLSATDTMIGKKIDIGGEEMEVTALALGNPNVIFYVEDVEKVDVDALGEKIGNSAWFPKGADVEFVEIVNNDSIKIREWKRETGNTSGSIEGASAALVASVLNGKCAGRAKVYQPGGVVDVEWKQNDSHVYAASYANTIYKGEIPEEAMTILLT